MQVPSDALIVLIGAAASGKSAFAKRNFPDDTIVSSDALRASLGVGRPASRRFDVFDELAELIERRMAAGALTVVDATNTDWMRRSQLIEMARRHGRPAIAIVFDLPVGECLARNAARRQRVPTSVIHRQAAEISRDLERLDLEGFSAVHVLHGHDEIHSAQASLLTTGR